MTLSNINMSTIGAHRGGLHALQSHSGSRWLRLLQLAKGPPWLQVIAALAVTLLLGAAIVFRGLAGPAYLQEGIQDTVQTLGGAMGWAEQDEPRPARSAPAALPYTF